MEIVIAMPVFNDWEAAFSLCRLLAQSTRDCQGHDIDILMIDDGSSRPYCRDLVETFDLGPIRMIKILRLRRNLGHQRAIAIGLTHLQQNSRCEAIIVMDADGEDRPSDVPLLIDEMIKHNCSAIVFAERGRRVEGLLFRTFYLFYRTLHRIATGTAIRIGNFSIIPRERLNSIVVMTELWNHYAAAVLKSRIPYTTLKLDRGSRLQGKSKMNFSSLVIHGLSALFAYHELVGTRLLMFFTGLTAALLASVAVVGGILAAKGYAIPSWSAILTAVLILLAGQSLATSFSLIFSIMMTRSAQGFLPLRDFQFFVLGNEIVAAAPSLSLEAIA